MLDMKSSYLNLQSVYAVVLPLETIKQYLHI